MDKKKKDEELQSRREFFKKAAKGALPILGAAILASNPIISKAAETTLDCNGNCSWGCGRVCSTGCSNSCSGSCYGSCKGNCSRSCSMTCSGSCSYTSTGRGW